MRQKETERWSEVKDAAALYCIAALFTSLPASLLLRAIELLFHTVFISEQLLPVAGPHPCLDVLDGSLSIYLHTSVHLPLKNMDMNVADNPVYNLYSMGFFSSTHN